MERKKSSNSSSKIDRLSDLPENLLLIILSFLPPDMAARTSVLSHLSGHLWDATHLILIPYYSNNDTVGFDRALLQRDPNYPLIHLIMRPNRFRSGDYVASFLLKVKKQCFGLRHLKVDLLIFPKKNVEAILPIIFPFDDLLSVSLGHYIFYHRVVFPSNISLIRLKSLSLCLCFFDDNLFNELVSRLYSLEELFITLQCDVFNLASQTVRKLDLAIHCCDSMTLAMPNLECLNIKMSYSSLTYFSGEMSRLSKVFISHPSVRRSDVPLICRFLKNMTNVKHLKLDFTEGMEKSYSSPVAQVSYENLPLFPNLKFLDLTLHFHEETMGHLIRLFLNCPVLESVNLIHKRPDLNAERHWSESRYILRLPRNDDGSYDYGPDCFHDLHIKQNRE